MKYEKPEIIAQNAEEGTYAAGCPAELNQYHYCKQCERTEQIEFNLAW